MLNGTPELGSLGCTKPRVAGGAGAASGQGWAGEARRWAPPGVLTEQSINPNPVWIQRLFSPPQADRRQELSWEMSHSPGEETTRITRPGGNDSPPSGRRWGADGTDGETALVC